jgi:hypothetical protein
MLKAMVCDLPVSRSCSEEGQTGTITISLRLILHTDSPFTSGMLDGPPIFCYNTAQERSTDYSTPTVGPMKC